MEDRQIVKRDLNQEQKLKNYHNLQNKHYIFKVNTILFRNIQMRCVRCSCIPSHKEVKVG